MKKVKLTVEVECTDSTYVPALVSDLSDCFLCDNVKKGIVEYEEDGVLQTEKFMNPDFEEQ